MLCWTVELERVWEYESKFVVFQSSVDQFIAPYVLREQMSKTNSIYVQAKRNEINSTLKLMGNG